MRKELYCNSSTETKKAYLTRAARLLDIIRNHPEMVSSHPVLSGITPDEVKAFEKRRFYRYFEFYKRRCIQSGYISS